MTERRLVMDPTSESAPERRERRAPLKSVKGLTIGLLDISKARGNVFLDRIEEHLSDRGAKVERFSKPTFARVAPIDLKQEISTKCDAVIEALAD